MSDSEKKITLSNYPGNSHASRNQATPEKEERKKLEKVTSGVVVQRKTPLFTRIKETFIGDDIGSVGNYILLDVFIPAAKSTISDAFTQAVERMLFGGDNVGRRSSNHNSRGSYVSYNRMHDRPGSQYRPEEDRPGGRPQSQRARMTHQYEEIILDSRGDAELVLDRLGDLIGEYGVATVADLYDLVGITENYTDNKFGWYGLGGAHVSRVRDGFLVNLPKTSVIE